MAKPTFSSYVREHAEEHTPKKEAGPFVTISRRFGCDGYGIGKLVLEKANEKYNEPKWKLYHKELITRLSEDTGLSEEAIEKERLAKPSLLKDIFRGIGRTRTLDSFEIRNKMSIMMRELAFEGFAIIIGQGGATATSNMSNGVNVRIEASMEWRIPRVCRAENISRDAAIERILLEDRQREMLTRYYKGKSTKDPTFHLVIDNSVFNIDQIAEQIVFAMEQKNLFVQSDK